MTQCLYCVLSLDLQWQPVPVSLCGESHDITVAGALTRAVVRLERETEVFPDGATAHPIRQKVLTTADVKASFDRDNVCTDLCAYRALLLCICIISIVSLLKKASLLLS